MFYSLLTLLLVVFCMGGPCQNLHILWLHQWLFHIWWSYVSLMKWNLFHFTVYLYFVELEIINLSIECVLMCAFVLIKVVWSSLSIWVSQILANSTTYFKPWSIIQLYRFHTGYWVGWHVLPMTRRRHSVSPKVRVKQLSKAPVCFFASPCLLA